MIAIRLDNADFVELVLGEIESQVSEQSELSVGRSGLTDDICSSVDWKGGISEMQPVQSVLTRIYAHGDGTQEPVVQEADATERAPVELDKVLVAKVKTDRFRKAPHESGRRPRKGEIALIRWINRTRWRGRWGRGENLFVAGKHHRPETTIEHTRATEMGEDVEGGGEDNSERSCVDELAEHVDLVEKGHSGLGASEGGGFVDDEHD